MSSAVCRVCLGGAGGLRLLQIDEHLLEMYEKLTTVKVGSEVGRLCYICHSQLQKCHRFVKMAHRAEQYLKTFQEMDTKVKNETMNNMLKLVKPQLSVLVLKPISLDGVLRKKPKKALQDTTNKQTVDPKEIEPILDVKPVKEELVRNESVIKRLADNGKKIAEEKGLGVVIKELTDTKVSDEVLTREVKIEPKTEFVRKIITTEGTIEEEMKPYPKNKSSLVSNHVSNITESVEIHNNITDVEDYVVINDTELYYECDVCNDIFTTREDLAAHQSKHKSEKKQKYNMDDILNNLPKTKKPYCPICKKFMAGYASQLIEHLKIHTGERPYICDTCGKTSRTKHHMQEHIRIHTKEKVYCRICKKGFTQSSSLGKHMRGHIGGIQNFCHLCGKTFTQSGQLRMHIRSVHEGIKPHCCEICGKRFAGKSEWTKHMNSHAGIKAYTCDRCGIKVASNATLSRHKKHHCKMG